MTQNGTTDVNYLLYVRKFGEDAWVTVGDDDTTTDDDVDDTTSEVGDDDTTTEVGDDDTTSDTDSYDSDRAYDYELTQARNEIPALVISLPAADNSNIDTYFSDEWPKTEVKLDALRGTERVNIFHGRVCAIQREMYPPTIEITCEGCEAFLLDTYVYIDSGSDVDGTALLDGDNYMTDDTYETTVIRLCEHIVNRHNLQAVSATYGDDWRTLAINTSALSSDLVTYLTESDPTPSWDMLTQLCEEQGLEMSSQYDGTTLTITLSDASDSSDASVATFAEGDNLVSCTKTRSLDSCVNYVHLFADSYDKDAVSDDGVTYTYRLRASLSKLIALDSDADSWVDDVIGESEFCDSSGDSYLFHVSGSLCLGATESVNSYGLINDSLTIEGLIDIPEYDDGTSFAAAMTADYTAAERKLIVEKLAREGARYLMRNKDATTSVEAEVVDSAGVSLGDMVTITSAHAGLDNETLEVVEIKTEAGKELTPTLTLGQRLQRALDPTIHVRASVDQSSQNTGSIATGKRGTVTKTTIATGQKWTVKVKSSAPSNASDSTIYLVTS